MAGWASGLAGWVSGLAGEPTGGGTDGWTYGLMENLSILQDFVPYRGYCPTSPMKTNEKEEQGKGNADHMMPLGFLYIILSTFFIVILSVNLNYKFRIILEQMLVPVQVKGK